MIRLRHPFFIAAILLAQTLPARAQEDPSILKTRQRIADSRDRHSVSLRLESPAGPHSKGKSPSRAQQAPVEPWMSKVDPLLLRQPRQDGSKRAKSSAERNRDQDVAIRTALIDGEVHAEGFLRLEPGTDPHSIPGFRVRSVSPDGLIATGSFRRDDLPSIAGLAAIRGIEPSLPLQPLLRSSREMIGVDQVHLGANLPQAYKGQGVVVGVFDSGIDADNADFSNSGGTRIQHLLEYTFPTGSKEWTKAQIDANPSSVTQRDGSGGGGHGTHVTGTAAGGGRLHSDFAGMAPESDIVFVKGVRDDDSNGGFYNTDIVNGVQYIFEKAADMSKPAVVNLSLGSNYGPLDGTSAFEQYLTSLQGDGRIIVAAAGNEGMDYIHTGGDLAADSYYTAVDAPYYDDYFFRNIWYDAGSISQYRVVAIRVEAVAGKTVPYVAAMTDWLDVGTYTTSSGGGIQLVDTVANETAGYIWHQSDNTADPDNGDGQILIEVDDGFTGSESDYAWIDRYVWAIMYATSGSGRMDSYGFDAIGYPFEFTSFTVDDQPAVNLLSDRGHSVGTPATADSVISVGAFVSSNTFVHDNGSGSLSYPTDYTYSTRYQPALGEIAYFSSRGPTRDGRLAPIVSAPGDKIFATRSQDIPTADLYGYTAESGNYLSMQGTSMAAPHVTGVIALMLQADPTLDYADIVDLFEATSTSDDQTGGLPNMVHGYGRIQAHDALIAVAGASNPSSPFDGWAVALGTQTVRLGENATLPLTTQAVVEADNLISYQFSITLPAGATFVSTDTAGTMAGAAEASVTTNQSGSTLRVSVASSDPMTGSGTLLKLTFAGSSTQTYTLTPSAVYLNNTSVTSITAGSFTVTEDTKGDVDDDNIILAYDAALVLQYSVGKDPLPTIDPLPWEAWRAAAADIDGDGEILAADASYILQYTVGLLNDLTSLPKSTSPRIRVEAAGGILEFSVSESGLTGMNLSLPAIEGLEWGTPFIPIEGVASSMHSVDGLLNVAIATIEPLSGPFLRIPFTSRGETTVEIRMRSNTERQDIVVAVASVATSSESGPGLLPDRVELLQNYPNPFNPSTQIRFALPHAAPVTLEAYDMLGRRVAVLVDGGTLPAGWHEMEFDAGSLPTGSYVIRMEAGGIRLTRMMMLVR